MARVFALAERHSERHPERHRRPTTRQRHTIRQPYDTCRNDRQRSCPRGAPWRQGAAAAASRRASPAAPLRVTPSAPPLHEEPLPPMANMGVIVQEGNGPCKTGSHTLICSSGGSRSGANYPATGAPPLNTAWRNSATPSTREWRSAPCLGASEWTASLSTPAKCCSSLRRPSAKDGSLRSSSPPCRRNSSPRWLAGPRTRRLIRSPPIPSGAISLRMPSPGCATATVGRAGSMAGKGASCPARSSPSTGGSAARSVSCIAAGWCAWTRPGARR